ncbi:hypothetical protein REJC140_00134 [Pseudorhizobium endolithicum]|uniref:Uncharacterized protein n=1 Tax=Pseudorhizobium endolithicum TaxID=1191678 RepID=A0ABM8PCN0_9HYPH|nr:hypothetical protein [Pseudorhizobium endolithicum]CAD7023223.1 hypothetical protein REJC140_00134 [Pseudorhizobium endolithicum]
MSYRQVDFDAVAPLMPFDKTASQVAGKGEHFHWEPPENSNYSADPIPFRRPSREELIKPSFVDLTGKKIGRFTVMGVASEIPSNGNGQRWVVRCQCSAYETRKAKVIKAHLDGTSRSEEPPMCCCCSYTRKLQLGYHNPKKAAAAAEAIIGQSR